MTGFSGCLRLGLVLLFRRLLPRVVMGATLLLILAAVFLTDARPGEGFRVLAAVADLLVVTVAAFGAIFGGVAVAGDAAPGALRAVLIRPIARPALVISHAVLLAASTAVLYLGGLLLALPLIALRTGFGDVRLDDYVITGAGQMAAHALRLCLLPLPALCCAPLLALTVSVVSEDVASAVVISLALVGGPLLFGKLIGELPDWSFPARAVHPVSVLGSLAQGVNTRERSVAGTAYVLQSIGWPLLWAFLFTGAAVLLFHRREVKV